MSMIRSFPLALCLFAATALGCGDKDPGEGETAEPDSGASDTNANDSGGAGGSDACTCETGTLIADSGCDTWGDQNECSGWASVYCENNPEDCPNLEYDITTEFASGTAFAAFGCTICVDCGDGACSSADQIYVPPPLLPIEPACPAYEAP